MYRPKHIYRLRPHSIYLLRTINPCIDRNGRLYFLIYIYIQYIKHYLVRLLSNYNVKHMWSRGIGRWT